MLLVVFIRKLLCSFPVCLLVYRYKYRYISNYVILITVMVPGMEVLMLLLFLINSSKADHMIKMEKYCLLYC